MMHAIFRAFARAGFLVLVLGAGWVVAAGMILARFASC